MSIAPIEYYCAELRSILLATLSPDYVDEVVAEASNHLAERAEQLCASGMNSKDAEERAVGEFGPADEIALAMAKEYPPRTSDPRAPNRRTPEGALVIQLLSAAVFGFFGYQVSPYAGLEFASFVVVASATVTCPGAFFSALARLRYPRMRPVPILVRSINYALGVGLIGTSCLLALKATSHVFAWFVYPFTFLIYADTVLVYALMRATSSNGRAYHFLRRLTMQEK